MWVQVCTRCWWRDCCFILAGCAESCLKVYRDMAISDRVLGKKNVNGKPRIDSVRPAAALPGGEIRIVGSGLRPPELRRPRVQFGEVEGSILVSSDDFVIARVPEGATPGPAAVATDRHAR